MTTTLPSVEVGDTVDEAATRKSTSQWHTHRVAASVLRGAILVVPLGLSAVVGIVSSRIFAEVGLASAGARLLVSGIATLLAFGVLKHLANRLLPLAMLLRLSLVSRSGPGALQGGASEYECEQASAVGPRIPG
jgi:hypothetical protein